MVTELDEDSPLWLVNEQIKGLLEGDGADEDHQDVLTFLRDTGLPEDTIARMHRALVCAEKGEPVAYRQMSSKFHCWDYSDDKDGLRKDNPVQALFTRPEANGKPVAMVTNLIGQTQLGTAFGTKFRHIEPLIPVADIPDGPLFTKQRG